MKFVLGVAITNAVQRTFSKPRDISNAIGTCDKHLKHKKPIEIGYNDPIYKDFVKNMHAS